MSTQNYDAWQVPSPPRRPNSYLESLRMDLSRAEQQLSRATHRNHVRMLKAAVKDITARIRAANGEGGRA